MLKINLLLVLLVLLSPCSHVRARFLKWLERNPQKQWRMFRSLHTLDSNACFPALPGFLVVP